jgi:hypothetical protein
VQALTSTHAAVIRPIPAARRPQGLTPTKPQFEAWLRQAAPGDRIAYYQGHLAVDRVRGSSKLSEPARRELIAVANLALALANSAGIHLVQQRTGPGTFRYIAVKAHPARAPGSLG